MFDTMKPPLVFAHGVGADGIVLYETVADRKPERCRIYKDKGIAHEMRWQAIDIFAENQYANEHSAVGPNGAVLPLSNNSDKYNALWQASGNGIICWYDEVWPCWYWYTAGTATDSSIQYVELSFRPRKVTYSGLIKLWEFENRCSRPCDIADNVIDYPCIKTVLPNSTVTCGIADTKTVADDAEIKLPNGKDTTGAQIKLAHNKREGYVAPCIKTCKVDPPPPDALKFEPKKYLNNIYNALIADIDGFLAKELIPAEKADLEKTNMKGAYETIIELLQDSTIVISELYSVCTGSPYLTIEGEKDLVTFWETWKLGGPADIPGVHEPRSYYAGMMCIHFIQTLQSFQFIAGKTFDFNGNDSGKYNHIGGALALPSLRGEGSEIEGDAGNRSKNCAYFLSNYELLYGVELILPFQEEEAPPAGNAGDEREKQGIRVPPAESENESEVVITDDSQPGTQDDARMDEK